MASLYIAGSVFRSVLSLCYDLPNGGLTFVQQRNYETLLLNGSTNYPIEPPLQLLSGEAILPLTSNKWDEAHTNTHPWGFGRGSTFLMQGYLKSRAHWSLQLLEVWIERQQFFLSQICSRRNMPSYSNTLSWL